MKKGGSKKGKVPPAFLKYMKKPKSGKKGGKKGSSRKSMW